MRIKGLWALGVISLGLFLSPQLSANAAAINTLLQEAKVLASKGDYEGAAKIYHQVLALDRTHSEARQGLSTALMNAQIKEPEAEETDALKAVLSQNAKEKDNLSESN